jgi:hypothetical protein
MATKTIKTAKTSSTKNLVIEFLRYSEIASLDSESRFKKIIDVVKENKILLLEGRLTKQEEILLIQKTMQEVSATFKGIEIAVIESHKTETSSFMVKVKEKLATLLLGNREGLTLIGPASVINEIKQNPHKLNQLSIDFG